MNSAHYNNQRLAKAREQSGKTREQIADEIGVTLMTISRIENGIAASYESLQDYCAAIGRNVKEFLYDEAKKISLAA